MTSEPQTPLLPCPFDVERAAEAIQRVWQGNHAHSRPWNNGTDKDCVHGLPGQAEWFRKVARAALSAQTGEPDFDGWPIEALEEIERMRAAIERGEYTELPPLGDSRRRAKTPQPDTAPSPLSTGEVRQIAGWQPSKYTDGPNESGYFTAGIDIPMEKYGKPDTHYHAIEFHAKDQTTAEARRDLVIVALSQPPATEQTSSQT